VSKPAASHSLQACDGVDDADDDDDDDDHDDDDDDDNCDNSDDDYLLKCLSDATLPSSIQNMLGGGGLGVAVWGLGFGVWGMGFWASGFASHLLLNALNTLVHTAKVEGSILKCWLK